MIEERKPFRVRCEPCGHVWIAAYLPMEMARFANLIKGTKCPNCAAGSETLFLASFARSKAAEANAS